MPPRRSTRSRWASCSSTSRTRRWSCARYAGFLAPGGVAAIAVPNARSLHRLVGQRAGLLDDLYRLSEHDLALGHRRYFDRERLVALVEGAGLRVAGCEGILLKLPHDRAAASGWRSTRT